MKTRCPAEVRIYCQASDSGVPSRSDGGFAEADSVGRRREGSEKGGSERAFGFNLSGLRLGRISRGLGFRRDERQRQRDDSVGDDECRGEVGERDRTSAIRVKVCLVDIRT